MPKLPDYTALGEAQAPTQAKRVPVVAEYSGATPYEGMAARETEQAGANLQEAGRFFVQAQEQHDVLRAEDAFNQLRQQQANLTYGDAGFTRLQGANAVNQPVLKSYGDQLNSAATQIAGGLDNDYQRQLFMKRAAIAQTEMQQDIMKHVATQQNKYADDVLHGSVATEQQNAALGGDIGISQLRIHQAYQDWGAHFGIPENDLKAKETESVSSLYAVRTAKISETDPVAALQYFNANKQYMTSQAIATLEPHVVERAKVVQADQIANDVVAKAVTPQQAPTSPTVRAVTDAIRRVEGSGANQTSVQGAAGTMQITRDTFNNPLYAIPGTSYDNEADRVKVAENKIAKDFAYYGGDVQKTAAAYIGGRGAVNPDGSIKDVRDALGTSAQTYAQRVAGLVGSPNQTVKASMPDAFVAAHQEAEKLYPGDIEFRKKIDASVSAAYSKLAAAQNAQMVAAHQTVVSALFPTNSPKPTTMAELQSIPGVSEALRYMDPRSLSGVESGLRQNLGEANKEFSRGNPALFNGLLQRIWLPQGSDGRVNSVAQLSQYMADGEWGSGLNATQRDRLAKEIADSQNPDGNPLLKQTAQIKETGRKMLTALSSDFAMTHGDLAEEASYRFGKWVDDQVAQYQKDGKDPRPLFTPGAKEYVLDPAKVNSFKPTEQQIAAIKAGQTGAIGGGLPTYQPNQVVTFKQGSFRYKGGPVNSPSSWEAVK